MFLMIDGMSGGACSNVGNGLSSSERFKAARDCAVKRRHASLMQKASVNAHSDEKSSCNTPANGRLSYTNLLAPKAPEGRANLRLMIVIPEGIEQPFDLMPRLYASADVP